MVGFVTDEAYFVALKSTLEKMQISNCLDSIPYGEENDPRHQVFVYGSAAEAVSELPERYRGYRLDRLEDRRA